MAETTKQKSIQLDMRNRRISSLDSRSNSPVGETNVTPQVDKDRSDSDGKSLLHNLARAGNVIELTEVIDRVEVDPEDPNGNTILHVLAEIPSYLTNFFQRAYTEGKIDFVQKLLTKTNTDSQTFLAVAISNVSDKKMESDVIKLMDIISETCMEEPVETVFQHKDEGRNNLLHLAVEKNLQDLVRYLLITTQELSKEQNLDGCNPFHYALYQNNTGIISCFFQSLETNKTLINDPMPNKETPLHLAAKWGNTEIVKKLIRHGGDLSLQDDDGHTPLHDSLQQVHYEGGSEDNEKCEKFIRVWNAIVEEAVTWWCLKHSKFKEIKGSASYYSCQQKAVYYLRSCILNEYDQSVLLYGAVMGLVPCVQAMLVTKDVFVVKHRMLSVESPNNRHCLYIDVTNLSPEYKVSDELLLGAARNSNLEDPEIDPPKGAARNSRLEDPEIDSSIFLLSFVFWRTRHLHKAADILGVVPLLIITSSQWRISQWFTRPLLILHLILMLVMTFMSDNELSTIIPDKFDSNHLFCMYATLISGPHIFVMIFKCNYYKSIIDRTNYSCALFFKYGILNRISAVINFFLNETSLRLIFGFCTFGVVAKEDRESVEIFAGMKGFSLLLGWLVLLAQLQNYAPVYQLTLQLRNIIIKDMGPWILLYVIISTGFASAIKLQFQLLPNATACVEEITDFGRLGNTFDVFYELILMTCGLDTDLNQLEQVGCLFFENQIDTTIVKSLLTLYAVIAAVLLLNMLIAVMTNTLNDSLKEQGWRLHQVQYMITLYVSLPPFQSYLERQIREDRAVYDGKKHRWYLPLTNAEAREIRAKIWQNELTSTATS